MLNLLDIIGLTTEPGVGIARPFDLRGETAGAEAGAEFTAMFTHLMARFDVLGAPDAEAPRVVAHKNFDPGNPTIELSPDVVEPDPLGRPLAKVSGRNIRSLIRDGQFVPALGAGQPHRALSTEVPSADGDGGRKGMESQNSDAVLRVPLQTESGAVKHFAPIDSESPRVPAADTEAHSARRPVGDVTPMPDTGVVQRDTVASRSKPLPLPEMMAREAAPPELHRADAPMPDGVSARAGGETKAADAPKTIEIREAAPIRFVPLEGRTVRPRPEVRSFQEAPVESPVVGDGALKHDRPVLTPKDILPANIPAAAPRASDSVEKTPSAVHIEPVVSEPAANDAPPVRHDARPHVWPEENKQKTPALRTPRNELARIHSHEPLQAIEPVEAQPATRYGRPQPAAAARYREDVTIHSQGRALSSVEGDFVESYRPIETGSVAAAPPLNPGINQEPRGNTLVSGVESVGTTIEQEVLGSLRRLDSPNEEFTAEIRLQPRELGSVKIRISVSDHRVELQLAVDSKEIRQLVQSHSNELRAVLEDRGYSLTDINVFVSGERDGNGGLEDRSDQGWSQAAHASTEQEDDIPSSANHVLTEKRVNLLV